MEIENLVQEKISAFTGQKSSIPHGILQPTDAEGINNFIIRKNRLRKIWGAVLYASALDGDLGRTSWLDYFKNRWFSQRGNGIAVETAESSAVFTRIGEMALGVDNKVSSERFQNRLYLVNGADNKFFESTKNVLDDTTIPVENFLTFGLIPPGRGKRPPTPMVMFSEGASFDAFSQVPYPGSVLENAPYSYVLTWWDANRRIESLPHGSMVGDDGFWISRTTPFSADLGNFANFGGYPDNALRISVARLKNDGYDMDRVTHFIIYRATQASLLVVDGTYYYTEFKRIADPDNSGDEPLLRIANNSYDDHTAEGDLGLLLDPSNSPPPGGRYYFGTGDNDINNFGPRFIKLFLDRLWLFGVRYPGADNGRKNVDQGTNSLTVPYFPVDGLAYVSEPQNFDYFKNSFDIGRSTGQKDTGLAKHRNTLMFFKESSVYYLDGTDLNSAAIRELDTQRGVIAPGSLQETPKGVIGLSADCFAIFDGIIGKPISDEVADEVEAINLYYADKITSTYDSQEDKYECHVPIENTYNTKVFIYDLKTSTWSFTTRAGGAAAYGIGSDLGIKGLLGDSQNGRLYKTNDHSVRTFNGQAIFASFRSKHFDFGSPGALKSLQRVLITARAVSDFRISLDVICDFGEGDAVTIDDINPDVRSDQFAKDGEDEAGADWDGSQWSGAAVKKKFSVLVQCVAKNFQLVIRNSDTDADKASFEIEEVVLQASAMTGSDDE